MRPAAGKGSGYFAAPGRRLAAGRGIAPAPGAPLLSQSRLPRLASGRDTPPPSEAGRLGRD